VNHDKPLTLLHREPRDVFFIEQLKNIALCAVELSRSDALEMNDEVEVLPHFVVVVYVYVKSFFCLSIERLPVNIANETHVLYVKVSLLFLFSKLCKCIDNNTEYNVEKDSLKNQKV